MKLTILLLLISSFTFGQTKPTVKRDTAFIAFDEYEKMHIDEWNQKEKDFQRGQAEMNKFYTDVIRAKGFHVNQARVANNKDSVRLTSNGILYIYKPLKKTNP